MIRRSFFQILSGLLLPVPGTKTALSIAPVPSGLAALLATLGRSAAEAAPPSTIEPAFAPGDPEFKHFGKEITPCAPAPPPGQAPALTANGGDRSTASRFASNPDPEWLREWQSIPRLEIREDDLHKLNDPCQRALAAEIIIHIRVGRSFAFRYFGGSHPGEIRRALPTSLFGFDPASHYPFPVDAHGKAPKPTDGPLYLLGWCQTRNAPRTFRLDRIQLMATEN